MACEGMALEEAIRKAVLGRRRARIEGGLDPADQLGYLGRYKLVRTVSWPSRRASCAGRITRG